MGLREFFTALLALLVAGLGLLLLERPRTGLEIRQTDIGGTPATLMHIPQVEAPVVVIAHGFAGSRPLMHPIQLTLARAGYITVSYDLEGHGRNPQPLRGDVNDIHGTTQFLVEEALRVAEGALALPGADGRLAFVGHSMASDIVIRAGLAEARADAVVALSAFSEAITAEAPGNLLLLNGQYEPRLRAAARAVMAAFDADEGEVVSDAETGFLRAALVVPRTEHVGILYARASLLETRDWLNASFGRRAGQGVAALGLPLLVTLAGLVLLALPFAQAWPEGARLPEVPAGAFWVLAVLPAVLTPLMLRLAPTDFLPVLVADYLAVHLAIYGVLMLVGLILEGDRPRLTGWPAGVAAAVFGLLILGSVLDRYGASFMLSGSRWQVFLALVPGALVAMVADATLIEAGRARLWRRLVVRLGFLASLGIAVALDPERLFFLVLILPVMVLFYLTFGVIGGATGRRTGSSVAMGIAMGLCLAWALAAAFPLFEG